MDVNRALRSAASTGKVVLGQKEALRAVANKQAKLLVVSANLPAPELSLLQAAAEQNGVPVYKYTGPNTELGPAAGKPFSVSTLAVLEAGESDVLALAKIQ